MTRRHGVGAELCSVGVHFRVWAPDCRTVDLVLLERSQRVVPMLAEDNGYFSVVTAASPGTRYAFRLDGGETNLPDPASRYQPRGRADLRRSSTPRNFTGVIRTGAACLARTRCCTRRTWARSRAKEPGPAAQGRLSELVDLGITALQIMPVAEFPGRFGWSYDPANLFAPSHLYGEPDDFRAIRQCGASPGTRRAIGRGLQPRWTGRRVAVETVCRRLLFDAARQRVGRSGEL